MLKYCPSNALFDVRAVMMVIQELGRLTLRDYSDILMLFDETNQKQCKWLTDFTVIMLSYHQRFSRLR